MCYQDVSRMQRIMKDANKYCWERRVPADGHTERNQAVQYKQNKYAYLYD